VNPKFIIILVLVLVIAAFVVAAGGGAFRSKASGSDDSGPPWYQSYVDSLGGRTPLNLNDVTVLSGGTAAGDGVFVVQGQLRLNVNGSQSPVRMATLSALTTTLLVSIDPKDENGVKLQNIKVERDKPLKLTFTKDQTGILISAVNAVPGQPVRVRLLSTRR
jgi:hypothetical protein